MRAELSCLIFLGSDYETPVQRGSLAGVQIELLSSAFRDEVFASCPLIKARNQLEYFSGAYTHRLFIEIPYTRYEERPSNDEWQPFLETIMLSRVVKLNRVPYHPPWLKTLYPNNQTRIHHSSFHINSLSVSHSQGSGIESATLTQVDADRINQLWPSFHEISDPANRQRWGRIVRAMRFFEYAQTMYFIELQTPLIHAALESLICTSSNQNRAQVTQRLVAIAGVSIQEANQIYDLCCDFKHEAQALQQLSLTSEGQLAPSDQERLNAASKLQNCVREILLKSFDDRSFAETIADVDELRRIYPVLDRNGGRVP
jgi:hypothetical protein